MSNNEPQIDEERLEVTDKDLIVSYDEALAEVGNHRKLLALHKKVIRISLFCVDCAQ